MPTASFPLRFPSRIVATISAPRHLAGALSTAVLPAVAPRAWRLARVAVPRAALLGVTSLLLVSATAFAQSSPPADSPGAVSGGQAAAPDVAGTQAMRLPASPGSPALSDAASDAAPGAVGGDATPAGPPLSDEEYTERAHAHDAQQKTLDERTARMNYAYAVAQHNCYAHFFVNHCLTVARDTMRVEKGQVRTEQLALSAERRSDRARQRETRAEEKRVQTAADAPQRAANEARNRAAFAAKQQQHQLDLAKRGQDGAEQRQRAANAAAYRQKQAAHQQALDQANRNADADAAKRAENVHRYEQKQSDAADRQRDLDARRRKAQERANKSAPPPASAPAARPQP
ncbi:hypothetical protein OVY01_12640 [Robbsia sp. Bb-Pol-6]|uniref:Colicin transporter n=1 Tax=Robbsia betulipollinis TaxID=2981849 RepID=A0ABT3ZNG1_9BURK|nr:hypothetical protein [Robbsia betulipollinis]MCY0388069.1 hypothetical protein [Robbsia betulipollinis]